MFKHKNEKSYPHYSFLINLIEWFWFRKSPNVQKEMDSIRSDFGVQKRKRKKNAFFSFPNVQIHEIATGHLLFDFF